MYAKEVMDMETNFDKNRFYEQLDSFFKSGNAGAAEQFMKEQLILVKALQDQEGIIGIENELGGLYRAKGLTNEAQALYQDALERLRMIGAEHSLAYATTLINYGDVFLVEKHYSKAIQTFLEAKEILESFLLQNDYRMAALYNNLSAAYRLSGKLEESEKALKVSWRIIHELENVQAEEATTLINLAQLQTEQGKLLVAKENLDLAIDIYERVFEGHDVHYPVACAAYADIHYLEGDYEKAINMYHKALALIEKNFGKSPVYDSIQEKLKKVMNLSGGI